MADSAIEELLKLNQRLLDSIARSEWDAYQELCDASLSAFEPESLGQLVEGMKFHRFYFAPGAKVNRNTTMSMPKVRLMGDVAVITYVRLDQAVDADGAYTRGCAETRVWQRCDGQWKHVHFHRSPIGH